MLLQLSNRHLLVTPTLPLNLNFLVLLNTKCPVLNAIIALLSKCLLVNVGIIGTDFSIFTVQNTFILEMKILALLHLCDFLYINNVL